MAPLQGTAHPEPFLPFNIYIYIYYTLYKTQVLYILIWLYIYHTQKQFFLHIKPPQKMAEVFWSKRIPKRPAEGRSEAEIPEAVEVVKSCRGSFLSKFFFWGGVKWIQFTKSLVLLLLLQLLSLLSFLILKYCKSCNSTVCLTFLQTCSDDLCGRGNDSDPVKRPSFTTWPEVFARTCLRVALAQTAWEWYEPLKHSKSEGLPLGSIWILYDIMIYAYII